MFCVNFTLILYNNQANFEGKKNHSYEHLLKITGF